MTAHNHSFTVTREGRWGYPMRLDCACGASITQERLDRPGVYTPGAVAAC